MGWTVRPTVLLMDKFKNQIGLTLLELLIAMGIVGVMVTFALPSAQRFINKREVANHMQIASSFIQEGRNIAKRSECAVMIFIRQSQANVTLKMRIENEPSVECRNWRREVQNTSDVDNFTVSLRNTQLMSGTNTLSQRSYRVSGTSGTIKSDNNTAPLTFALANGTGEARVIATANIRPEGLGEVTYE